MSDEEFHGFEEEENNGGHEDDASSFPAVDNEDRLLAGMMRRLCLHPDEVNKLIYGVFIRMK